MKKRRAGASVLAVKALEQSLGVPLKRTKDGFYLAVLPKDHPVAVKAGNNRLLIAVKDISAFEARRRTRGGTEKD